MSTAGANRPARVAERVKQELMALLLKGDLRDPGAGGVYVSSVRVTADLQLARVYIRLTDGAASEARKAAAVRAMKRAAGYLRRQLAPGLKLRHLPELLFFWDEQVDRAARVEQLLDEIGREHRERAPEGSEPETPGQDGGER